MVRSLAVPLRVRLDGDFWVAGSGSIGDYRAMGGGGEHAMLVLTCFLLDFRSGLWGLSSLTKTSASHFAKVTTASCGRITRKHHDGVRLTGNPKPEAGDDPPSARAPFNGLASSRSESHAHSWSSPCANCANRTHETLAARDKPRRVANMARSRSPRRPPRPGFSVLPSCFRAKATPAKVPFMRRRGPAMTIHHMSPISGKATTAQRTRRTKPVGRICAGKSHRP